MSNFNKNINKYKKYAFRKIGKYFGPCVIGTMISLGVAVTVPSNDAHASIGVADGEPVTDFGSNDDGYEVIIPKGAIYRRNDEIESHKPRLVEKGHNGRSFILPKNNESSFNDGHPLSNLFTELYDKDGDDNIDDEYKNPNPVDNSQAGQEHDGEKIPYRSKIDPKYPHVVDSGLTSSTDDNRPGVWKYNPDGKYTNSDGVINENDTIVIARKPFTVNEDAEENVVNSDGSVVLSNHYRIHVNDGDDINKKDDVYEVGTQPKVEEKEIPVTTTYVEDPNKEFGTPEVVENPGKAGKVTTKTPYNVDEHTGKVTEGDPVVTTEEMTPKVVKVGTKPKVVETPIPYTTRYEKDDTIPKGEEREKVAGKEGKTTTTTTYTMDSNTGTVTPNQPTTEEERPIERVVLIGAQPKVEEKEIPVTTTYVEDPNKEFGTPEVVENPGKAGKVTTKTPYNVDEHTGKVTEGDPDVTTEEMIPKVVKVGTKPKVVETPIPYTTRYEKDDTIPKGEEREKVAGKEGKTTTTTTYTMDPNTGTVTPNKPTTVEEQPIERVVLIGAQPKVEEKEIPVTTTYVEDPNKEFGTPEVVENPGKAGKVTTKTPYNVDEHTGKVTEGDPDVTTEEMTPKVVKVGTKPKVVETPIPYTTRYVEDNTKDKDYRETTQVGVKGKETTTTTYTMDPNNGTVTENTPTVVREEPKEEIITVGTKPKVVETPETPQPEKPGETPETPQPEETGTKEVTRTIKYVDEKGNEVEKSSTDKVKFTRESTNADWKAVDGDSTFDAVKSPVVKGYILKDANQKEVSSATVKSDTKDETITVTYTKVGSYVPKVPEGVTPPSPTPYDNAPEDPTKVVTPNPEKPQDPQDPNSPKVPVLPQVPGHTPVVPKDPTKPVSPENPLVPLTPVDPNHPEKGYNVPPVPTTPGQDTPIEYVKDGQQKAITSFVDPKGNVLETPITETGDSNTPLTKDGEIKAAIAKLKLKGYDVETNTYPSKGTFDNDPKVDQYFKVTLTPRVKPVKPFDPTNPKDPNKPVPGQPIDPDTPVDPNNPNDPTIPRWTDELINKLETTKQVTRTINYVDEKGNELAKPSTDKVTFTRVAKINVVTGEITYGDWKAVGGDDTFDKVPSPVVKGYILKDPAQKVVEKETVKSDAKDEIIAVTYTKVGSYVPKVPEGVTPPSPTPYDNDPEDPTKVVTPNPEKPQDPKDPNSPKVPVLPRVPGHTPVVPKDPTKPVSPENPLVSLTPVDPNHPEKGYNVPPVPTTPGQDTPIEYVKDGQQRAIVNFVDENGNSVAVSILQTGKAGDKFTKDTLVKSTISELQSKGYELRTSDYPKEGTGVFDNDSKVDQIFTVTVRKIEVLPPRPRVIERPGGNTVVEVGVPNKDADKLNIWYIKRNNPTAPKEEIVTKKDNGTWKIEKAPEGVTINPSTGIVSIPGDKIQPKTWIDTQTKHETKFSKIVSVMPNIHDLTEFEGITMWIEDKESKNLKDPVDGVHERGEFTGYEWKESILEGNIITHIFKKLSNPDNPKSETGINVLPPTPKIVDRPGGGGTVEVGVPNKDADTLIINYTKRNNPNDPKEEIITKKDKDGTWKIEKSPDGVTINPTTGVVYIPSKQIEPKTFVDTQTKHGDKSSKVVSVVPNISELKEFKGVTEWIDVEGKVLKPSEEGIHEKGRFDNLVWLESVLEGNTITHIFGPGTPTVDKPEYKVTVWFDKDGNPIKPDQPGTHESGKIPGYRFITTTTKDGVTVHKFEKITPVAPNKPTPENPNTPNLEKQQVKRLANTGATETNTGLAGLGLAMFGMALTAIKRRKEK